MTGLYDSRALVGVLGAGTMGGGIAQVAAVAGHPVVIYDISTDQLTKAVAVIERHLRSAADKGRMPHAEAEAAIDRITTADELSAVSGAALVIEAAPEILDLKRSLFMQVEHLVGGEALITTNTSTLPVSSIVRSLSSPERGCGLHFFNPAPVMPLVEVIPSAFTATEVVAELVDLTGAWGKTPIVAADTPGFIVNRVARPFYGEALRLLGEGVADVATIDSLARDAGFPMGPFELMDLIGIDVNLAAARSVFEGFFGEPRFRPHPIQQAMVDSGRLGRKTGRGYYAYDEPLQ